MGYIASFEKQSPQKQQTGNNPHNLSKVEIEKVRCSSVKYVGVRERVLAHNQNVNLISLIKLN